MKSLLHFPAPHIVPGMNLTAERFAELFAWISACLGDTVQAALARHQYGLMIPYDGKTALRLEKSGNRLVLSRCCGITPQGTLISWFEDQQGILTCPLDEDALQPRERYRVMIEALHRPRHPFGPESPDLPLRPMHSSLDCRLLLRPYEEEQSPRPDGFCVGILAMTDGCWNLAPFIPPCLHIGADPVLKRKYLQYCDTIRELMEAMPVIIRDTDSYRDKAMIELREFVLHLGSLLAAHRSSYLGRGDYGNPADMFVLWSAFAQQASFLLACLRDRRGFNNLLYENTQGVNAVSYTPQILQTAIQDMVNLVFDQDRLLELVAVTDEFLATIVPVFKALALGHVRPTTRPSVWEDEPTSTPNKNSATW